MKAVCRSDKKRNMPERSELVSLPERCIAFTSLEQCSNPEGQRLAVTFFGLLFWRSKKGD